MNFTNHLLILVSIFFLLSHFCLVFSATFVEENQQVDDSENGVGLNSREVYYEEPYHRNFSRQYIPFLPRQRTQRSSSFRLEDNGSKLQYLRTPHDKSPNLQDRHMALGAAGGRDDSNALFCYYQSVQMGYDLGPTVTKCTMTGHNACMLLENTRSGVREMSCISATDCELTRLELLRTKADGNVKLTCCLSNLCNSPSDKSKEHKNDNLPPSPPLPNKPPRRDPRPMTNLRERQSLFKPVEESAVLSAVQNDPSSLFEPLPSESLNSRHSDKYNFVAGQPVLPFDIPSQQNSRRGSGTASSHLVGSRMESARRDFGGMKTTPQPLQNSQHGRSQSLLSQTFEGNSAFSSLMNRVLSSRRENPIVAPPDNKFPASPSFPILPARDPSSESASALGFPQRQQHRLPHDRQQQQQQQPPAQFGQQQQPSEEDLYRQMMMLFGGQEGIMNKQQNSNSNSNSPISGGGASRLGQRRVAAEPPVAEHSPPSHTVLASRVCDFPPLMPHAWVSVASLEVGSEIYYQCSNGYHLDGPRVATCSTAKASREGRRTVMSHPRWSQVPKCVQDNLRLDTSSKDLETTDIFPSPISHRSSARNARIAAENAIRDHYKNFPNFHPQTQPSSPSSSSFELGLAMGRDQMTMPATLAGATPVGGGNTNSESNNNVDSDGAGGNADNTGGRDDSDRVTQCYDNRAGSVFVASCRGDSVICTRIVTTGSSSMSSEAPSPYGRELADHLAGMGQQKQVSQYCALLEDCLRFERWVRLAHRDDIDVLCCSTDLCNV